MAGASDKATNGGSGAKTLDLSNLTPKQQAAFQRALAKIIQSEMVQPTEPDLSQIPTVLVANDRAGTVNVYKVQGENLVHRDGTVHKPEEHKGFSECPRTGLRLGHAPVAYNGNPVESLEDAEGLARGDESVLAKYAVRYEDQAVA